MDIGRLFEFVLNFFDCSVKEDRAFAVSIVLAITALTGGFIARIPMMFQGTHVGRALSLNRNRYTGTYFECLSRKTGAAFTILRIYFDYEHKEYRASGIAFDVHDQPYGDFWGHHITFPTPDRPSIGIVYFGSRQHNPDGSQSEQTGYVSLELKGDGSDVHGTGHVFRFRKAVPIGLQFRKLTPRISKKIAGSPTPKHADDYADFVRAVRQRWNENRDLDPLLLKYVPTD